MRRFAWTRRSLELEIQAKCCNLLYSWVACTPDPSHARLPRGIRRNCQVEALIPWIPTLQTTGRYAVDAMPRFNPVDQVKRRIGSGEGEYPSSPRGHSTDGGTSQESRD